VHRFLFVPITIGMSKLHLATIWLASIGTLLSAYFIVAANSWMQHPVGYQVNTASGRAELHSIWAVQTNSTTLVTFPHTITACFLTAGAVLLAVSAWHLKRGHQEDVFRPSLKIGALVVLIAGVGVLIIGDLQARIMTKQQPMKMAAAEALYNTSQPAGFSIFTIGSLDGSQETASVRIPDLLSFMATGSPFGEVEGINNLQQEYEQKYGPGDYRPYVPVTYWSFRLMIGFGGLAMLVALWFTRRGRPPAQPAAVALRDRHAARAWTRTTNTSAAAQRFAGARGRTAPPRRHPPHTRSGRLAGASGRRARLPAHPAGRGCQRRRGPGRTAVHDVSFDLPPGARVALTGPSGSGKSTVAALLVRFLDPSAGRITLDGVDLRRIAPDRVRQIIATCPRTPTSSTPPSRLTCASPDRGRTTASCVRGWRRPVCWIGPTRFRTVSKPSSVSTA
jgi:hypothetical protein